MTPKDPQKRDQQRRERTQRDRQEKLLIHQTRLALGIPTKMPLTPIPRPGSPEKPRFTPARGPKCQPWEGRLDRDGYGITSIKGKPIRAHRLAWIETHGPIPDGLFVCHHCDNRACCNPTHLFLGTHSDNMKDAYKKGRITIPRTGPKIRDGKSIERRKARLKAIKDQVKAQFRKSKGRK